LDLEWEWWSCLAFLCDLRERDEDREEDREDREDDREPIHDVFTTSQAGVIPRQLGGN